MALIPSLLNGGVAPSSNITVASVTTTGDLNCAGNVNVTAAGKGLRVKEGSNAKQGTASLSLGAVTVANTAITANSRVLLTAQVGSANAGALSVSTRSASVNFVISSTNVLDARDVAYEIIEPA